jgi:hypothetical protein
MELRNTTLKYQNASTQSRVIKNAKNHKRRAKLQGIFFLKNLIKERRSVISLFLGRT